MTKVTDAELFDALSQTGKPVRSSKQIADELNVTRQGVHKRLSTLEENNQVTSVKLGRSVGWYISEGEDTVQSNGFKGNNRIGDDFAVDIQDTTIEGMNEVNLLIQAGNNGYQLDLWWETNDGQTHQSNNWVTFNEQNHDYPHDNRHERKPYLRESFHGVIIYDKDPRAESVGYDGATLEITRTSGPGVTDEIRGYLVELTWTDEYENIHTSKAIAPLVDPRKNREEYYSLISMME